MQSIFLYASDETSEQSLRTIYESKKQDILRALGLPSHTKVEFDQQHSSFTCTLPSGEHVFLGPDTLHVEAADTNGILIALNEIGSKELIGSEMEILARIKPVFDRELQNYKTPVTIRFGTVELGNRYEEREKKTKQSAGKRFAAWIVSLLILPAVTATMLVWYHLVELFLSWFADALPRINKVFSFINDAIGENADTGIIGLLATFFVIGIIEVIVKCSQKLCASRKGTRYLVTGILGIVLAVGLLVGYILCINKINAILPLNWVAVLLTLYGLGVASFMLIRESRGK